MQTTNIHTDIENTLTLLGFKLRDKNIEVKKNFCTDMPVVAPSTRNQLHRPPSTTAPRAEVKGARVAAFVSCIPLMQPGCQGNCSLRCGRQNGHAPSTSNRPPTTMNTRVTEKPARKCGRV